MAWKDIGKQLVDTLREGAGAIKDVGKTSAGMVAGAGGAAAGTGKWGFLQGVGALQTISSTALLAIRDGFKMIRRFPVIASLVAVTLVGKGLWNTMRGHKVKVTQNMEAQALNQSMQGSQLRIQSAELGAGNNPNGVSHVASLQQQPTGAGMGAGRGA